ncbi:hypothetical protein GMI70_07030 [Eggerthellaceae bacterium zg-893]|nr:hypothetical protein [Eggerthellaceae bacterium zg-893]
MSEVQFLAANAGKMPKRDICQMLKRSSASVKMKAAALRKAGVDVCLRCYRPTLEPCPSCGRPSASIDASGMCEPCRRRDQLAAIHARIADLLPLLPPEERDTYERTEAKVGSKRDPLPEAPDTAGMTAYRRAYAEEAHAVAVEACVSANLRREVKAAQKRKERIEKKVKSMNLSQMGATK